MPMAEAVAIMASTVLAASILTAGILKELPRVKRI